jgi:putative oxidoreductase
MTMTTAGHPGLLARLLARGAALRVRVQTLLGRGAFAGPLLARLSVGVIFAQSGWGKLGALGDTTAFFAELGIPAPGFHAGLVAITELVGGLAVAVGLGTRFASVPLAFTMLVAIATAKREDIDGLASLLALDEFTYLAVFAWLAVAGSGAASIDGLIVRVTNKFTTSNSRATLPAGPHQEPTRRPE